MNERNKQDDLDKLALAFFVNLRIGDIEQGAWGLDDKRPFGSSQLEDDILDIIGWVPEDGENFSSQQEEYASELYGELGDYLAAEWRRMRKEAEAK